MIECATQEVLRDVGRQGRERPWRDYKMANELLAAAYQSIDSKKAQRLLDCCTQLAFAQVDGRRRLVSANCCRVRLCPLCQWRRSLKVAGQTQAIIMGLEQVRPWAYVLLTLTVRNVSGAGLSASIDGMMDAWDRLSRTVAWRAAVKGWYRGLEVTHNVDVSSPAYDTYHPHLHCLLAVRPSYFTSRAYLSREKWVSMWRAAARLDYDPQVDVRRVHGPVDGAVSEVAKYSCKSGDYLIPDDWDLTVDTVRLLDQALANRRLVAYGGVMRDEHRRLHLDDVESGDLINTDGQPSLSIDPGTPVYLYAWHTGYRQYVRD